MTDAARGIALLCRQRHQAFPLLKIVPGEIFRSVKVNVHLYIVSSLRISRVNAQLPHTPSRFA